MSVSGFAIVRDLGANGVWAPIDLSLLQPGQRFAVVMGQGGRGPDPLVWLPMFVASTTPFPALSLIVEVSLRGAGIWTGANSVLQANTYAAGATSWSATLNGTFASPGVATGPEIAAALFATLSVPAGAPGLGTITFAGSGAYADRDKLRLWQNATPDATLNNVAITWAGP